MAATVFGTINFGLTAETGFFAESFTGDYSGQEKYIADGDGDDVAGAFYKPEMTFSIDGAYNTTGSPTWVMGATLTIANIPTHTAFIASYTSGGRVIINSASVGKGNESEERRTIGGVFKPFMSAS
jgi:hypothetical protein